MLKSIKKKAQRLRQLLSEHKLSLSHAQCLQMYARIEGHSSWEQWRSQLMPKCGAESDIPDNEWRCFVAAINSNGEPDFCLVRIQASQEDLDSGAVERRARKFAWEQGFDDCMVFESTSPSYSALQLPGWCNSWDEVELVPLWDDEPHTVSKPQYNLIPKLQEKLGQLLPDSGIHDCLCWLHREGDGWIDKGVVAVGPGYLQLLNDAHAWYQTLLPREISSGSAKATIKVTAKVDEADLHSEDQDVAGEHEKILALPKNCPYEAEERIKDWFHENVPIKVLDDFDLEYSYRFLD